SSHRRTPTSHAARGWGHGYAGRRRLVVALARIAIVPGRVTEMVRFAYRAELGTSTFTADSPHPWRHSQVGTRSRVKGVLLESLLPLAPPLPAPTGREPSGWRVGGEGKPRPDNSLSTHPWPRPRAFAAGTAPRALAGDRAESAAPPA